MKTLHKHAGLATLAALCLTIIGCGDSGVSDEHAHAGDSHQHSDDTHTHADGSSHTDHSDDSHMDEDDHAHDEVSLAPATIGGMTIELAQGHGAVEPGKENHLVVKLPYSDNGATIVRAWLGTEDRTLSYVGKGEYSQSHGDYNIHAVAPNPLPDNTMWWIEIEKPDGTKAIGSTKPIL